MCVHLGKFIILQVLACAFREKKRRFCYLIKFTLTSSAKKIYRHSRESFRMMSIVDEKDPTVRTFKIVRKLPDGLAYALHIASKYHLTYHQLCARLKQKM